MCDPSPVTRHRALGWPGRGVSISSRPCSGGRGCRILSVCFFFIVARSLNKERQSWEHVAKMSSGADPDLAIHMPFVALPQAPITHFDILRAVKNIPTPRTDRCRHRCDALSDMPHPISAPLVPPQLPPCPQRNRSCTPPRPRPSLPRPPPHLVAPVPPFYFSSVPSSPSSSSSPSLSVSALVSVSSTTTLLPLLLPPRPQERTRPSSPPRKTTS